MNKREQTSNSYYFRIDKTVIQDFEKVYPHCRSRFCELAMKLACSDKKLFDKIFFSPIMGE